ncbi:hypothetical protein H0H87_007506 [Tephrocybe sp. NHM501043]|nr:hypothetical protein H0H87_007506 [Tephrocybe sp. NHM501043]
MASIPRGMLELDDYDVYEALHLEGPPQHETYSHNPQLSEVYGNYGPNFEYNGEAHLSDNLEGYWQPSSSTELSAHMRPLEHQLMRSNSSPQYPPSSWEHTPPASSHQALASGSNYPPNYRSPPGSSHSFGPYSTTQESPGERRSMSSELVPSPYSNPSHLSPPHTPSGMQMVAPGDDVPNLDGHREQLRLFKEALQLPLSFNAGPFIPQKMYMPHTNSDRRRYVEEIDLQRPIYFWMEAPDECGIPLVDALHSRVRRLRQRDEPVFEGRGPSISVRIQVRLLRFVGDNLALTSTVTVAWL